MPVPRPSPHSKRWGRVAAKPSEYLIQIRRGKVVQHGPGLSVFLWPGDTCTVLPTSIQRTTFTADQITAEKVGVAVTGIAVYRIADPLLAFRMLDFTDGGDGVSHLNAILRDMFIGAARRLVASMTVEQCLTRRKESIANELVREIQPVVSGQGRPDDATDQGWGIVVDTIEIQDVRILSEKVFADLQTPYRAALELAARSSEVQRDHEVHLRQVDAQRAALEVDQELARRRGDAEHALREHQLEQRAALAVEEERRAAEIARQRATDEAALQQLKAEAQIAVAETEAVAATRLAAERAQAERLQGELQAQLKRLEREVENLLPEQRLRYDFVVATLPAIAQAFAKSLGPVHLTQIGTDGTGGKGVRFLTELFAEVVAVGRSAGIDLATVLGGQGQAGPGSGQ